MGVEEPAEVAVHGADIIVVRHRAAPHVPRIGLAGCRIATPLSVEHRGVLLVLADECDPFLSGRAAQMLRHHNAFALSFFKLHKGNPRLQSLRARQQSSGSSALSAPPTVAAGRGGSENNRVMPCRVFQAWHIGIEVHAVDPLDRQPHMTLDDLGDAMISRLRSSGFASRRRLDPSSAPTEAGSTRLRQAGAHHRHMPRRFEMRRGLARPHPWHRDVGDKTGRLNETRRRSEIRRPRVSLDVVARGSHGFLLESRKDGSSPGSETSDLRYTASGGLSEPAV